MWNKKGREISFDKLWKFIVSRSESLHEAIMKLMETFSNKVNTLLGKMIEECEKLHQLSRKTTLQMIDEMNGDCLPTKINLEKVEISCGCDVYLNTYGVTGSYDPCLSSYKKV